MTVQLAGIDHEAAERARRAAAQQATISYGGTALMADVRAALRAETHRYRLSESETDALAQIVAARALDRPALTYRIADSGEREVKPREQRRAALADVVKWLCRDSRQWKDSADGWKPREAAERTERGGRKAKPRPELALSAREQAERYREAERAHDGRVSLTSSDALAERHTVEEDSDQSGTDWLAVAAEREREREAGEALPAPALAEHNRELTRAIARRLAADYASDLALFTRCRGESDLRCALYCHAGEALEAVALAERVSIATAKRRSARGTEALRVLGAEPIREARRALAAQLGLCPPDSGPVLSEAASAAERALRMATRAERRRTASYLAGARGESRLIGQHGSAREVLAYLAAAERSLSLPAHTYATAEARPAPSRGPLGYRHAASAKPPAAALPRWASADPSHADMRAAARAALAAYRAEHERVMAGWAAVGGVIPA